MKRRADRSFGFWLACAFVAGGVMIVRGGLSAQADVRVCSTKVPTALARKLTEASAATKTPPANETNEQKVKRTTELAVQSGLMWPNASKLRVRFMNTPAPMQERILSAAQGWSKEANITFVASTDERAEIRISTVPDNRSWSYIGMDAKTRPLQAATMQFGWLTPESTADDVSSVVLHEFGHALGAIHEHQSPKSTIEWNEPVVRKACASMGWNEEECRFNILDRSKPEGLRFTRMDPTSIMMYSFPGEWTKNNVGTPWNTALAALDREFIRALYPRTAPPQ